MLELLNIIFDGTYVSFDCKSYDLANTGIFKVKFNLEKEELITRLTGRRVCKACGASFHVVNIPPKQEGVCDYCGGELIQRADDNLETVTNRIDVYEAQTMPLIDYYEKAGNLVHIDGSTGLENVFADIVSALGE